MRAHCKNISKFAERNCPGCGEPVNFPDTLGPGATVVISEERYLRPYDEKDRVGNLPPKDRSQFEAGDWFMENDRHLIRSGKYTWSRATGKRVYHNRLSCLAFKHPYISPKDVVVAKECRDDPAYNQVCVAWSSLQYGFVSSN